MGSGGNKEPAPPQPTTTINQIKEKSLFEQLAEGKLKAYSDWEGKDGRDIMAAPGMSDLVDIYGSADSLANERNLANPGKALSGGGSGDYQAQIEQLGKDQRYGMRAEGLSRGLTDLKAQAYGAGGDAAQMGLNRLGTALGAETSMYNNYWQRQAAKKPLWEKIAGLAIGGVAAASGFSHGSG